MTEPNLLVISAAAFVAVIALLSLLAGIIRVLMAVFPAEEDGGDAGLLAAVTAVVAHAYPGTRITKIEESR